MMRFLKYHARSATPLFAFTSLMVAFLALSRAWNQLASATMSTGILGALGEGVDEFHLRVGAIGAQLLPRFSDAQQWIASVAVIATAISVVAAVRQLMKWIHGPGDAVALTQHAARRAADVAGVSATRVRWGVVYDAETHAPLPLARVHILDARGSVIARTIADTHGSYGFRISSDDILFHGGVGGVLAHKSGYHHDALLHPQTAGTVVRNSDIPMTRFASVHNQPSGDERIVTRMIRSAAFWSGVLTVPMVYVASPSLIGAVLVALFGFSAIVRAVGTKR